MLVLPILVPLSTAAVMMLAPKRATLQRSISLIGSFFLLAGAVMVFLRVNAAGVQALQVDLPSRSHCPPGSRYDCHHSPEQALSCLAPRYPGLASRSQIVCELPPKMREPPKHTRRTR